jgi:hypothetical protein
MLRWSLNDRSDQLIDQVVVCCRLIYTGGLLGEDWGDETQELVGVLAESPMEVYTG